MQTQLEKDWFYKGFKFGMFLVGQNDLAAIRAKLVSVSEGEMSLLQSPDEVRQKIPAILKQAEEVKGSPVTDQERAYLEKALEDAIPKNRAEQDAVNRQLAAYILTRLDDRSAQP